jgi:DNA-binding NarL/FixJ family response regulator
MNGKINILYIIAEESSGYYWENTLRKAVSSFGRITVLDEVKALRKLDSEEFDLIIVDSDDVYGIEHLITLIRAKSPISHIIIASDVCTWRRAREAFHLGASEYVQKSLNHEELREQVFSVLSSPLPKYPLNLLRQDSYASD